MRECCDVRHISRCATLGNTGCFQTFNIEQNDFVGMCLYKVLVFQIREMTGDNFTDCTDEGCYLFMGQMNGRVRFATDRMGDEAIIDAYAATEPVKFHLLHRPQLIGS